MFISDPNSIPQNSTSAGHQDSSSFFIHPTIPLNIESLHSGVIIEGQDCDLVARLAISTEKRCKALDPEMDGWVQHLFPYVELNISPKVDMMLLSRTSGDNETNGAYFVIIEVTMLDVLGSYKT